MNVKHSPASVDVVEISSSVSEMPSAAAKEDDPTDVDAEAGWERTELASSSISIRVILPVLLLAGGTIFVRW